MCYMEKKLSLTVINDSKFRIWFQEKKTKSFFSACRVPEWGTIPIADWYLFKLIHTMRFVIGHQGPRQRCRIRSGTKTLLILRSKHWLHMLLYNNNHIIQIHTKIKIMPFWKRKEKSCEKKNTKKCVSI